MLYVWWVIKCNNKIIAIVLIVFLGPLGIILYELFGPTPPSRRAKVRIATCIFLVAVSAWAICYKTITGYYPILSDLSWFYYVVTPDVDLKATNIDSDFVFDKKGYVAVAEIKHAIPLTYQLVAGFENDLPIDFVYKGKILIELSKDNKILYSEIVEKTVKSYYSIGEDRRPSGIRGFAFTAFPFIIAHKKYINSTIKVTVINEDTTIHEYIESAKLSLLPSLGE